MTNGVLYFIGQGGAGTAVQSLEQLHSKTLARSLAFIDLLEESELPLDIDKPFGKKDDHSPQHSEPKGNRADLGLRCLRARMGRTKLRFAYCCEEGGVIVLSTDGNAKGQPLARIVQEFERAMAGKSKHAKHAKSPILKSHRELVAELTLSDPILAAYYTKAREQTQFALSLIRLRNKASLTNETLAQRTGLSVKLINSLTRGRLPKLETMRRLADALQARIVIGPAGGIVLESDEVREAPAKRFVSVEPTPIPELPISAELLLVQ